MGWGVQTINAPGKVLIRQLEIRNFVILENFSLQFTSGLTVFTGETGAGKSLVVDSLQFLIGQEQAPPGASVQAIFSSSKAIEDFLRSEEIETTEEIYLSRESKSGGRTVSRLNGTILPISKIKKLSPLLMDIQNQHSAYALLESESPLFFLDLMGGKEGIEKREEVIHAFQEWQNHKRKLNALEEKARNKDEQLELYRFEIREIEEAGLQINEENTLRIEKEKLQQIDRYQGLVQDLSLLSEQTDFTKIIPLLDKVTLFEPTMKSWSEKIKEWDYEWVDFLEMVRKTKENFWPDPARLEHVIERLDKVHRLQKKYGGSIEAALEYCKSRKEEIVTLESMAHDVVEMKKTTQEIENKLDVLSKELSVMRQNNAKELKKELESELKQLDLPHAQITINLVTLDEYTQQGKERAEFLVSFNPSEPLLPVEKVASGGELSRVMLALKTVLISLPSQTLIFDEVDSGLGGDSAFHVAKRLKQLSRSHQLICVSHLHQVASEADQHIYFDKKVEDGKTIVSVKPLNNKEKVHEIARMMAGKQVTQVAVKHAQELLGSKQKIIQERIV